MKQITFEKLKDNIVTNFYRSIEGGKDAAEFEGMLILESIALLKEGKKCSIHYELLPKFKKEIVKHIDNMDIRSVCQLKDKFPTAFPKFIRQNHYSIELSDNGWVFYDTNFSED